MRIILALIVCAAALAIYHYAAPVWRVMSTAAAGTGTAKTVAPPKTRLGINLFGLAPYNRQQVFTNLIAQSGWFASSGKGWTEMPPQQIDARGWIAYLESGQTAPRPLVLPAAHSGIVTIRCTFAGRGMLSVGGIARERDRASGSVTFDLAATGTPDEGAWIELQETESHDPLRDIDCRDVRRPRDERFHPDFIAFVRDFDTIRFLDWQGTNGNAVPDWAARTRQEDASQAMIGGASIEDMVDLANLSGADPWFLMPYEASEAYIAAFARLVHARLDSDRTAYVELGNEVWNDMFPAARQARREGLAMGLGGGDPMDAQMVRYAQKTRQAMQIWAWIFADRPHRLVRVAATQNANPALAELVLQQRDVAGSIDALATAPYIWIDLAGRNADDVDWVFSRMPEEIERTIRFAEENRAIARRHGKRFIAYEGGQHLVTPDLALARALQRDPRMGETYARYLQRWREQCGDLLTLYASTAPIAHYGSWGLREYAGQPPSQTPKLRAVQRFMRDTH